jgi:hypothetical protein
MKHILSPFQFYNPGTSTPATGTSFISNLVDSGYGYGKTYAPFYMDFIGTVFPEFLSIEMTTVSYITIYFILTISYASP